VIDLMEVGESCVFSSIYNTNIKIRNYEVRLYGGIHYLKPALWKRAQRQIPCLDCELHFLNIFFQYYQYLFISQDVYKTHRENYRYNTYCYPVFILYTDLKLPACTPNFAEAAWNT